MEKRKLKMKLYIKNVLKQYKNHPQYDYYQSILDFNQLALKMIVDTTYGDCLNTSCLILLVILMLVIVVVCQMLN